MRMKPPTSLMNKIVCKHEAVTFLRGLFSEGNFGVLTTGQRLSVVTDPSLYPTRYSGPRPLPRAGERKR
jgi:hypothetical protein